MSWRRWAHLVLALVGVAMVVYGGVAVADPHVTCRGVEMRPGDVCHKNEFGTLGSEQVQTYEERLHAARLSQPVVIGMGVVVAAFGFVLLRSERR